MGFQPFDFSPISTNWSLRPKPTYGRNFLSVFLKLGYITNLLILFFLLFLFLYLSTFHTIFPFQISTKYVIFAFFTLFPFYWHLFFFKKNGFSRFISFFQILFFFLAISLFNFFFLVVGWDIKQSSRSAYSPFCQILCKTI